MGNSQSDFAELNYNGNNSSVVLAPGSYLTCFDLYSIWTSSTTNGGIVVPVTGPGVFQGIFIKGEGFVRLHLEGSITSSQHSRIEIVKAGELITFGIIGANNISTVSTERVDKVTQRLALYQIRVVNAGSITASVIINNLRFSAVLI